MEKTNIKQLPSPSLEDAQPTHKHRDQFFMKRFATERFPMDDQSKHCSLGLTIPFITSWPECMRNLYLITPSCPLYLWSPLTNSLHQPQFSLVEKHSVLKNADTILVKQLFLIISQNLLRMLHLSLQQGLQQQGLQQALHHQSQGNRSRPTSTVWVL